MSMTNKIKTRPLISIVLTTYNSERVISQVLYSIVNQEFPLNEIEIIIIDDGSRDKTKDILIDFRERYREKFYDIKIIFHEKNFGVSKARNDGLRIAQGDYILILDHDVVMQQETLRKLYEYLSRSPPKVIAVVAHHQHVGGGIIGKWGELVLSGKIVKTYSLTSCALIRKEYAKHEFYDESLGPPYTIYEDIEYGARAFKQGYEVHLNGRIKVLHLVHGGAGLSQSSVVNKRWIFLRFIKNRLNQLFSPTYSIALKKFLQSAPYYEKIRWILYSLTIPLVILSFISFLLGNCMYLLIPVVLVSALYMDVLLYYFNSKKLYISLIYSLISLIWRILRSLVLIKIFIDTLARRV